MYTGYFANLKSYKDLIPIAICQYMPKYIGRMLSYKKIAPPENLLSGYKQGNISNEGYKNIYRNTVLNCLDARNVLNDLKKISEGHLDQIILLCYERPDEFCHRHLFADWFQQKCGIKVHEYQKSTRDAHQLKLF